MGSRRIFIRDVKNINKPDVGPARAIVSRREGNKRKIQSEAIVTTYQTVND